MELEDRRKYRFFSILFVDCLDIGSWLIQKGLGLFSRREPLAVEPMAGERTPDEPLSEEPLPWVTPKDTHPSKTGPKPPILTGVLLIDQQHSGLLATIQSLSKAMQEDHGAEAVATTVGFLEVYTDEHFTYEEAYLEHLQFPDLDEHRGQHAYFRMQVDQLRQRLGTGDPAVNLELSHLLFHWLQDHILKEDLAYANWVRSRKAGSQ